MAKKKKAKKSSKRSRAAKKAAATRKRNHAKRSAAAKKAARSRGRKGARKGRKGKSSKRSRAAKKAARTRREKKEARQRAGKKAARCRKAKRTGNIASHKRNCKKPRRKSRKSSKVHGKANMSINEAKPRRRRRRHSAAPKRRRRSHATKHHKKGSYYHLHRKSRMPNPISGGGEFLAGFFGAVLGGLGAIMGDRAVATHALTTAAAGSYTDAPTTGQIYNSEAPSAPMWSSWKRLVVAAAAMGVPLGISMAVKGSKAKSFFQLAFFGAVTTTGVKLATDGVAQLTGKTSFGARFFAPELKADNDMAGAATTAQATYSLTGNSTTGFLSGPRRYVGASLIPPGAVPITNPNPGNSDFGPNPTPPVFSRPPNSFGPPGQGYNPNPVSPPQGSSQGTNLPPSGGGSQGGTVTPGTPVTPPSYMQPYAPAPVYPAPPGGNNGSLPIPQPMSNGSCGGGCGSSDFNPMTCGLSDSEMDS